MYAERFNPLIHKYPNEADAIARIAEYFVAIEAKGSEKVQRIKLDPQRLFDISQAGSTARLMRVIALLVSEHLLERRLVVQSPTGNGIAIEGSSFADVPAYIHDPFRDVEMLVTEETLKTFYQPVVHEHG